MLTASNITVQFDSKPLFEDVNVKFGQGNRYGLVGANGAGKSTFMKVLSGELIPQAGTVSITPGERIGVLKQDQYAYETKRVLDVVLMGHKELWEVHHARDTLYSLPEMTEEQGIQVAELEVRYAELDGYSAEARAGELLLGLDITESFHTGPMSALPPALKLRVLLAQVLFAEPDIFLLDEPTNNLDINTIRWLETVLNNSKATMIIISHDRHFLNSVCTHIADLDYRDLKVYPGNYDNFAMALMSSKQQALASNEKKKAEIEQLQAFVRRFSANASKAKQATSRARQLEKIKLDEIKPSSRKMPYIKFEQDKRLYRNALQVKNLNKHYGEQAVLKNVSFTIAADEKVGIIGATGAGKTTLLQCIMGKLAPDNEETLIKFAEQANIGYFPQNHADMFASEETLLDFLSRYKKPSDDEQMLRGALGRMLFSGDDIKKPLSALSGGEQVRMLFAVMTLQKHNILILDEPTNHLDMESIEALNNALDAYNGTVLLVSHDRELIGSIATHILEVNAQGIQDYIGDYESYLEKQLADAAK